MNKPSDLEINLQRQKEIKERIQEQKDICKDILHSLRLELYSLLLEAQQLEASNTIIKKAFNDLGTNAY